jgi:predicted DsbA family dithiol-disulfide isomerase
MDDLAPDAASAAGVACDADGCAVPAAAAPATIAAAGRTSRIDIVSDAICPWCWIGKRNLEGALAELATEGEGFEIHWRPFQLNPEMPAEGVERAAYRAAKFGSAARSAAADARVAEAGAAAGLKFRHDRMLRTPNTVDAHRLAVLAGAFGLQDALIDAMFQAYFQDGRDIGDHAVLADIAEGIGLERAEVTAFLAGDGAREQVLAEDAAFRGMGLSGVPTFALDGHVVFSGAMPAAQMAEGFRRGLAMLRAKGA